MRLGSSLILMSFVFFCSCLPTPRVYQEEQDMVVKAFNPEKDIPDFSNKNIWELSPRGAELHKMDFSIDHFGHRMEFTLPVGYVKPYRYLLSPDVFGQEHYLFFSEKVSYVSWWVQGADAKDVCYALQGEDGRLYRASPEGMKGDADYDLDLQTGKVKLLQLRIAIETDGGEIVRIFRNDGRVIP